MKRAITLICLLVFCVQTSLVTAHEDDASGKLRLTLDEAKRIALEQNPTLAVARAHIVAAQAAVQSARSAYYPSLNVSAGYTRIRDYATRPARDFEQTSRYEAGLSGSWVLFSGGARRYAELIATLGGETATEQCDDAKRVLLESVSEAFFVVIRSQNSMDISKQDAEFNRQLESDARERNRLGTAKASEVLNFQYQVEFAEANYIEAENVWRSACIVLGRLLVLDQDNIWENIELVSPDEPAADAYGVDAIPALLEYAREHRPDVRAARQAVQSADYAIKLAQADWWPTVTAFANYGFQRDGDDRLNAHDAKFNKHYDRNASFGVSASWNLFSGFATDAAVARAKASRQVAESTLEETLQQVEGELRRDVLALESNRRTLAQQTKLHDIAQKIRDLVHEEYLGGTATVTRLNEVQTDLTNAALALSNARVAVLRSLETLKATTAENIEGK